MESQPLILQGQELSYTKVSELLPGRSHYDIKSQWNVLKTIFNHEIKKEKDSKVSGTGMDAMFTSQWKYLKSLCLSRGETTSSLLFQHLTLKTMRELKQRRQKILKR